jgi:AcrR family transcriptional regulator
MDFGMVARESGVPEDEVRFEFIDDHNLLRRSFDFVEARSMARLGESSVGLPALERLRAVLLDSISDDIERRQDQIFWMEMEAAGFFVPEIRGITLTRDDAWGGLLESLVRAAQTEGTVGKEIVARPAARRLEQIQDGICRQWVTGLWTDERARQMIEEAIRAELGLQPDALVIAKRDRILEATANVIAREGARRITFERVAAASDVTPSDVSMMYQTTGDLVRQTLEFADSRAAQRFLIDAEGASAVERISSLLVEMIDDDPVVRDRWVIWEEVETGAVFDRELRQTLQERHHAWTGQVAGLIRIGQASGEIPWTVDAFDSARRLRMTQDGFVWYWLNGMWPAERTRQRLLDAIHGELGS